MPRQLKCECGSCKRCTHRAYMRSYYYTSGAAGGFVEMACARCGEKFECTGRNASYGRKFCTRSCKDRAKKDELIAARLAAKASVSRACLHCGDALGPEMRLDAAFCSEGCNQAAHNATRKASWKIGERQERVSRAYIISRDGGRCHLCGGRPESNALHLDHVVPLSRGGTHDAANIRVACAHCNLSKRADAKGEQLLLVG